MPRYFAFLRAINVGGRVVQMDRLRLIFESLGFSGVETFIASGNVIFRSESGSVKTLERKIESALQAALGYEVATFIRSETELVKIANYEPFSQPLLTDAVALNIVFLGEPLDKESEQRTVALRTEIDELHVNGREIYWLCRKKQSDSAISNAVFKKTLGKPATVRGVNTVKRLVTKYAGARK